MLNQLSAVLFDFVLPFILAMGVLVVVHEFGHYIVARWCGVKVLRFSVGFGRPIAMKRFGPDQTEWAIGAFPLGGYVKMLDEREGAVPAVELHRAFNRQSVGKRFLIVLAGPVANFLLAILAYWALHLNGVQSVRAVIAEPLQQTAAATQGFRAGEEILQVDGDAVRSWKHFTWAMLERAVDGGSVALQTRDPAGRLHVRELSLSGIASEDLEGDFLGKLGLVALANAPPPALAMVKPGGAGARAGLRAGDLILSVNDVPMQHWGAFAQAISRAAGQPVRIGVQRDGARIVIEATPDAVNEQGKTLGRLNVAPKQDPDQLQRYSTKLVYGPVEAIGAAVRETWEISVFSLKMLGKMVTGALSLRNLSGPITIADYAGQSVKAGGKSFLNFIALVSISLGILNLLPIPLLDGGHLMYYIAEVIKGRPVSERFMELGQQVGMAVLLALMLLAFYNDIARQLSG